MYFDPNEELFKAISEAGGFCNAHSHLDRAYTVTEQNLKDIVNNHLHIKWLFVDDYKHKATRNLYYNNISTALINQIAYGTTSCLSFIDLDYISGFRALEAAKEAKEDFKGQIDFKVACQTLKGIVNKRCQYLLSSALDYDMIDIIGALPGYDKGKEAEHIDILMNYAKKYDKRLHVHVDQLNTRAEKETELLAKKTMKHGLEGKVTAVHSISLAAHPKSYRKEVYKMSQDAGLSFITCPTAWIDSRRNEELTPNHNSVTPVDELIEHDLVVAIGSDNIHDVYKPFSTGDMKTEIKFLLESLHIYDIDTLVKISTENGLKVIGSI